MLVTAEYIKQALSQKLPGTVSHKKALPKNRVLTADLSQVRKVKYSSVLLLLFIEDKELTACLIKRPTHMKHHAGQIALPGGRIEKGETALETAFRETWEEIGIVSDEIDEFWFIVEFIFIVIILINLNGFKIIIKEIV